jgi:uncharacterized protein YkwD
VLPLSRVSIAAVITGAIALAVAVSAASSVGPHVLSGHGTPALSAVLTPPLVSPTAPASGSPIAPTTTASTLPTPAPPATTTPPKTTTAPTPTVTTPHIVPPVVKAPVATSPRAVPVNPITVESAWASAVLAQLNSERAQNGLAPLAASGTLTGTAHAHNLLMAQTNTMSHQLPGEAALGSRISAAGYHWRSVGENVGWTTNRSQAGVMSIETQMYDETPPDDGHRLNILSTAFTQVGIDVIVDSVTGRLWLTEDFGQPA